MNRQLILSLTALGVLVLAESGSAHAQSVYYGGPNAVTPYGAPRLSPYLNLLRGGNNPAAPAANYYMGVVPEIERRANAQQFGNAIIGLERQVTGLEETEDQFPTLPQTGHGSVFNNYSGYFNNTGAASRPPRTQQRPPTRRR
ncbi:MAG: hypothetical protein K2R98_32900 [Gemmataceae bacterium]|nr:hypothetical protein [Gemmataceae bacterium]